VNLPFDSFNFNQVNKGWNQVCAFLPSTGGQLAEGLSDLEIWRMESRLPSSRGFLLPLQVRHLHMLADGQTTGWSFANSADGVINGCRWLSLSEVMDLWEQRADALAESPAPAQSCGDDGALAHCQHSYGFGVALMPRSSSADCSLGGWLVPLTELKGFGDAGEWYGTLWPSGEVYKVSGLTHTRVGSVEQLLASLAR